MQCDFKKSIKILPTTKPPINLLSNDEKKIISNIKNEKIRREKGWSYIFTRFALRKILGKNPEIIREPLKKPYCKDIFDFNVTNSFRVFGIVWSFNHKVGIDIQKDDPSVDYKILSKRFFHDESLSKEEFYKKWCKHEAIVKCLGKGVFSKIDTNNIRTIEIKNLRESYYGAIAIK